MRDTPIERHHTSRAGRLGGGTLTALRFPLPLLLLLAALVVACGGESDASAPLAGRDAAQAAPAAGTDAASTPTVEPTATSGALATADLPIAAFERASGGGTGGGSRGGSRGGTVTLPVEIVPVDEFAIGLSGRYELGERGMVFYYPEAGERGGFWMKNTHIDLSIAFADEAGVILAIAEMQAESLDVVRPVDRYTYAVEAPAGWYADHDVAAGDRLRLHFDIDEWYPHPTGSETQ